MIFKSSHGHEDMKDYIQSAVIDNIFAKEQFENTTKNFEAIVSLEMEQEYATHLLPMLLRTCRNYLYRLPFIQANTDFGSFNRRMSPIPIPDTEEEQKSPLKFPLHPFTAYGMPFPIDTRIQKFHEEPVIAREQVLSDIVHPESRILLFLIRHDK